MRKQLASIFVLAALCTVPFFYGKLTHHFHPGKLEKALPYQILANSLDLQVPKELNQPFFLLANGSQSYALQSADSKLILKVFRYNRTQFRWLYEVKKWLHHKTKAFLPDKLKLTLEAYLLAFEKAPECTQLLYVHLERGGNLPIIPVTDRLGRVWQMDLSQIRFALQRKGTPFEEALRAAVKEDPEKARRMIDSLLALLEDRSHKQIHNADHNLAPNFGFIGEKAFELDCGNYRNALWLKDKEKQRAEVRRFSLGLELWLKKQAEEAAGYVHEKAAASN